MISGQKTADPRPLIPEIPIMNFNGHTLADSLSGELIGNQVYFLDEVDSTNVYATALAQKGVPEGAVIVADCQTKGKGRLKNRVWQSPQQKNLYTSIVLRPTVEPFMAPQLTLAAGVAVAEHLSTYCPEAVTLKWPNDVHIRGKKVCGILTEMRTTGGKIDFVIMGVGLNINMRKEDFHEEIRESSTSLREETGNDIPRVDFAASLYQSLGKWYEQYKRQGFTSIKSAWLEYSGIKDRNVRVNSREEVQEGRVLGIDDYGALLLFDEKKKTRCILAGDVSIIGNK